MLIQGQDNKLDDFAINYFIVKLCKYVLVIRKYMVNMIHGNVKVMF